MPSQNKIITILIADDHSGWIEGVRSIISKASDMRVVGKVQDGDHIKRKVAELKPDLLLLALTMPHHTPHGTGKNGCGKIIWERTLNLSNNQYDEGSIRWGGSNYNSGWQTVNSPGVIGYGVTVYTPMYAVNSGIGPSLNCGSLSLTGPIYPPYPPPQSVSAAYKSSNCQAR